MDVRMDGRVAVITGASTGLGLAMAKEFAVSGASVALLARKQDALAAAKAEVQKAAGKANIKIEAYSCDVAKAAPIAATREARRRLFRRRQRPDGCIEDEPQCMAGNGEAAVESG